MDTNSGCDIALNGGGHGAGILFTHTYHGHGHDLVDLFTHGDVAVVRTIHDPPIPPRQLLFDGESMLERRVPSLSPFFLFQSRGRELPHVEDKLHRDRWVVSESV